MTGKKLTPAQKSTPAEKKKAPKEKDADGDKKAGGTGNKKMQKRLETYSVYIYRVLK